jgi:hypothetical protein
MVLNMKRLGKLLAYLFPVIIVVGSLEVALRLMPELIPIDLLQHFHEEMRLKVAVQLDLPNRSDIQPVERDDGGPLLKKYRPNVSITLAFGDEGATDTPTSARRSTSWRSATP